MWVILFSSLILTRSFTIYQQKIICSIGIYRHTLKGVETPEAIALREDRKLYDPVATMNLAWPLISHTQVEMGADLDIIINDAVNKYIMGEIGDAEWEQAKEVWLKNGGQKIIDEYNEAYSLMK